MEMRQISCNIIKVVCRCITLYNFALYRSKPFQGQTVYSKKSFINDTVKPIFGRQSMDSVKMPIEGNAVLKTCLFTTKAKGRDKEKKNVGL